MSTVKIKKKEFRSQNNIQTILSTHVCNFMKNVKQIENKVKSL